MNKEDSKNNLLLKIKNSNIRLTAQRCIILDSLIKFESHNIKEIVGYTFKKDSTIGISTIYRFINLLNKSNIIDLIDGKVFLNTSDRLNEIKIYLNGNKILRVDRKNLIHTLSQIMSNPEIDTKEFPIKKILF